LFDLVTVAAGRIGRATYGEMAQVTGSFLTWAGPILLGRYCGFSKKLLTDTDTAHSDSEINEALSHVRTAT
jgi:hypothetical protein